MNEIDDIDDCSRSSGHKFLVSWDNLGLEFLMDVTVAEQQAMLAVLRSESITLSNPLQSLILRARANPQRHYEIYCFESEFNEQELRTLFDEEPQTIADAIRSVGYCLYSDRVTKKPVIT